MLGPRCPRSQASLTSRSMGYKRAGMAGRSGSGQRSGQLQWVSCRPTPRAPRRTPPRAWQAERYVDRLNNPSDCLRDDTAAGIHRQARDLGRTRADGRGGRPRGLGAENRPSGHSSGRSADFALLESGDGNEEAGHYQAHGIPERHADIAQRDLGVLGEGIGHPEEG